MPDVPDKKKTQTDNVVNAAPAAHASDTGLELPRRMGLVEMILLLLLAGIVFIFFFGLRQMKIEKAELAKTQATFEQILPTFAKITKAAKDYQANDEFGAYPIDISELFQSSEVDTKEFKFSFGEDGTITATSTPGFGREGIKVNYNIGGASYSIDDPTPDDRPTVLDAWLPEE